MKIALSFFLALTAAALSNVAQGGQDSPPKTKQDLVKQFKERRKHKATLTANRVDTPHSRSIDEKDGNLRKKNPSDGSNAAASRLSLVEMEGLVADMKAKLKKGESGELRLRDKEKERYEKFIKRFEELQGNDARTKDIKAPTRYKSNKHSEEFIETRGLVLGKTYEEREALADHIRTELADHEAGLRVMDNKLYEVKKHALLRYDKVNHPEMVKSTKMEITEKIKQKKSSLGFESNDMEADGSHDKAASTNEETVSDGKTSEVTEPDALGAPPRNVASSNYKDRKSFDNGVIVDGEEVKLRRSEEPRKTPEEKERYRKKEAGVKVSKTLHDDRR
eukprot:CCRYP_000705-RA/>CCRYP_000705-RA protein AED:0.02 eAED:0.02 QI:1242/1/1/1/0.5/0.33/3/114/334